MLFSLSVLEPRAAGVWPSRLCKGARRAAWAVAAIALAGLCGWVGGLPLLAAFGTDFPPLLPSGIVALLLVAAALLGLQGTRRRHGRRIARGAAGLVAAIAVLSLLERVGGLDLGLDFDLSRFGYQTTANLSVATACTFLLLAGALACAPGETAVARNATRCLAIAVAGIALVVLMGLVFRIVRFNLAVPSLGMAFPTALALLASSASLIAMRPGKRLLQFLEQDSPGAVICRRLLPLAPIGERTRALEQTSAALRESMALLRTIAASTPELIVAKDPECRIMMINPAALQALGLSREAALGHREIDLLGESGETRRRLESDREILESGQPRAVEENLSTPAGERTFLVTKSPLRDEDGLLLGLVSVATDITDRKRAQRELEQLLLAEHRLRGEAERASRAKDEFLAVVSHELRSPLNALKGWSQVLAGSADPDPLLVSRAAQAIKRNVEHQTRLIDDLLDTSRIILGKLVLERRPVNLVEVVHAALEFSRPGAQAKEIELRFTSSQPVLVVDGDPGRLRQVVTNLISNGIKFTPRGGGVDIRLRQAGAWVELAVADNGSGIEPDFLPHVFDRFSQADASTTRRYSGLGIGLALVRHLLEMHGGTVRAASPGPGQGSTFLVELPAAIRSDDGAPGAGKSSFHSGSRRHRPAPPGS